MTSRLGMGIWKSFFYSAGRWSSVQKGSLKNKQKNSCKKDLFNPKIFLGFAPAIFFCLMYHQLSFWARQDLKLGRCWGSLRAMPPYSTVAFLSQKWERMGTCNVHCCLAPFEAVNVQRSNPNRKYEHWSERAGNLVRHALNLAMKGVGRKSG